jgi:hypothetical protein
MWSSIFDSLLRSVFGGSGITGAGVLTAAVVVFTSQLSCQMVLRFHLPAQRSLVQIAEARNELLATESCVPVGVPTRQ